MNKILLLLFSFFCPLFIKKEYKLIVLRFDGNKFMFNTKIMFEYLIRNTGYDVKYIINDSQLRNKLINQYGEHFITQKSIKDIIYIAKAGAWLTDGGFPLKTPFGNSKRVLINLWHGMPIKQVGINGYSGLSKIRMLIQLKMISKNYNAFLVTTQKMSKIFQESFLISPDKIKVLGQPRNDLLFKKNKRNEILENLYSDKLPNYKKIILYAPTYRDGGYGRNIESTIFFPFQDFDMNKLEMFLENKKYIIFIRAHHLEKINFREGKRIKFLGNDKVNEISEILNIFDLLITDYSSLIFDFLLIGKPMLFLPYDLEKYREQVKLYFRYNLISPGPKPKSMENFCFEIEKLINDSRYFREERERMENFFNQVREGNCCRILKFLNKELEKINGEKNEKK